MRALNLFLVLASLCLGPCLIGCETSHTETDKPNLLGGHTEQEKTTYQNPITGQSSTSYSEHKTD